MLKDGVMQYLICSIVHTRGVNGATISEIRSDFHELALQKCRYLYGNTTDIVDYLNNLPGLVMRTMTAGTYVWYSVDYDIEHKTNLKNIKNHEKSSQDDITFASRPDPEANESIHILPSAVPSIQILPSPCTKNEHSNRIGESVTTNNDTLTNRSHSHVSPSYTDMHQDNRNETIENTDDNINESTLKAVPIPIQGLSIHQDFNVNHLTASPAPSEIDYRRNPAGSISYIGDDYLLSFLIEEYNIPEESACTNEFGHCASGQTIEMALHKLENHPETFTAGAYLVNLGAMDILMGRDIYDIQNDYKNLLKRLLELKKLPICTTLPPILITEEQRAIWRQIYQKLMLFNRFVEDFLCDTEFVFIDFWNLLTNADGKPVATYYQSRMKTIVSDAHEFKFALWNKLGRQTVQKQIRKYLTN